MTNTHYVSWVSHNRKAKCQPNPDYPDGIVVDNGIRPACRVKLPYPAECCGTWFVRCNECGTTARIRAAGRPDDPRSFMVPCKK